MTVERSLSSVPLFQFVAKDRLAKLAGVARRLEKRQGDAVILHGEPVLGIFLVDGGRVGVYPPGAQKPMMRLGPGDSFGEMSFLENARASATIRADDESCRLAVFLKTDLARVIEDDAILGSGLYQGIALTLSRKLRQTTERVATELKATGGLLQELTRREGDEIALSRFARSVGDENRRLFDDVDQCLRKLDDLALRMPEKAAPVRDAQLGLLDLKTRVRAFYPRLEQQLHGVAAFVKAAEAFLQLSVRD